MQRVRVLELQSNPSDIVRSDSTTETVDASTTAPVALQGFSVTGCSFSCKLLAALAGRRKCGLHPIRL
jgi:hypothetical protein